MKIAFYDNNAAVIKSFRKQHPHIHSVHVQQRRNPILKSYHAFYYPFLFSQTYPNNSCAKWLVSDSHFASVASKTAPTVLCQNVCGVNTDMVGSGMSMADMKDLLHHNYDVVVFEWYLTLSVCDYMGGKTDAHSYAEVALFHAGTLERFNALRAMFAELRRRGTKIFILSESTWITPEPNQYDTLDFILKTIQQLDGQLKKEDLIYSSNANKAETMKTNPVLSPYCRRVPRSKKRTRRR